MDHKTTKLAIFAGKIDHELLKNEEAVLLKGGFSEDQEELGINFSCPRNDDCPCNETNVC